MDTYHYMNETVEMIERRSVMTLGESSYAYMLGYLQSHVKGLLNSLETTLTPSQVAILEMELNALKRCAGAEDAA